MRPIKFEGSRTIEGFTEFMQSNTKEELVFVEAEEKYLKKKEEGEEEQDTGTCSGAPVEAGAGDGQCSAGKQEL